MPPSCALLGRFAIGARLLVLALCLVVHCGVFVLQHAWISFDAREGNVKTSRWKEETTSQRGESYDEEKRRKQTSQEN